MAERKAEEHPGHHWKEAERVAWFVARMDLRAEERRRQFDLLARLIPFPMEQPIRVLDLGAGYGALTQAVLDAFPNASAVLLDVSDGMLRVGRERLAPYGARATFLNGDFGAGVLPATAGEGYHAIVSSLAIHHLPPEGKQTLYGSIIQRLLPGGCFLNLDSVAAPNEALRAIYEKAHEPEHQPASPAPPSPRTHHSEMQPLSDHLGWLTEAGFANVDCFWKSLGTALFGGFKPA